MAAAMGHLPVVRRLLRASADAEASNNDGATALMLATYAHKESVVRALLQHGAREGLPLALQFAERSGMTALAGDLRDAMPPAPGSIGWLLSFVWGWADNSTAASAANAAPSQARAMPPPPRPPAPPARARRRRARPLPATTAPPPPPRPLPHLLLLTPPPSPPPRSWISAISRSRWQWSSSASSSSPSTSTPVRRPPDRTTPRLRARPPPPPSSPPPRSLPLASSPSHRPRPLLRLRRAAALRARRPRRHGQPRAQPRRPRP